MSLKEEDIYYGHMHGYPYHDECERLVIHKKKQHAILWKQLFNPRMFCKEMKREELLWQVLFWVGIISGLLAILVSFIKELDEGKVNDNTILHFSIAELILAIVSVAISLSKHLIKYNNIIKLQKNLRTSEHEKRKRERVSNRTKILVATCLLGFLFISTIFFGFLVLHLKDDTTDSALLYTKYTTTLTLFLVLALDGIINDVISNAFSEAKSDQYKLIIHQLMVELKNLLQKENDTSRISLLNDFLNSSELFSLENHFLKEGWSTLKWETISNPDYNPDLLEKEDGTA